MDQNKIRLSAPQAAEPKPSLKRKVHGLETPWFGRQRPPLEQGNAFTHVPARQKLADHVAEYGWHCVNVPAEKDAAQYSYTVGLYKSYKHPELIIFGLPALAGYLVMQKLVGSILRGRPLNLAAPADMLFEGPPCQIVRVPVLKYDRYASICREYYKGYGFPLYQIVWPTLNGQFPWDEDAPQSLRNNQPVLGHMRAMR
ncbi:MAG TPA: DUF4262 domain-containing protein [Burkholderiales bacterium]|nr:DUF4262 domain-containing protein [Burkholderiales bacterium]